MTTVRETMHRGAEWIEPDEPLLYAAQMMRDADIGAVPVGENDRLIGMITDRDITCRGVASNRSLRELRVRDVMSEGIVYCNTSDVLRNAVRLMEERKVRRLPVIDENKRMVGMLSLGDVSELASHDLTGEVLKAVSAHHA
jgi:CBS domain-containing protein